MIRLVLFLIFLQSAAFAACEIGYLPTQEPNQTQRRIVCDTEAEFPVSGLAIGDILYAKDTKITKMADSSTTHASLIIDNPQYLKLPNSTTPPTTDCDSAGEAGRIYYDTNATSGQRIFGCEGVSGWVLQGDAGSGVWGTITGTLATQTDLVNELALKAPLTSPTLVTPILGVATATSVNGLTITEPGLEAVLDLQDIQGAVTDAQVPNNITITNLSGTNTGDQSSVTGNAGTVTVADAASDTTTWPTLATSQTGSLAPATDGGLTYNANTDALTTTTFIGALTGTASGNLTSGGALGTPSSGTLTNVTGLPVAGITASTTTALGVGSVELGHATDTTLARSGAGAVTVEGVGVSLNSTSLVHTASSFELGAASDTTLARVSAGVVSAEGINLIGIVRSTNTSTSTSLTITSAQYGSTLFWSPAGTATATLPANGAASGAWFDLILLTNQTVTISAATADTLITLNDTAADSVAFSTASVKIGAMVRFISNGSFWVAVNLSNHTMTIAT